MVKIPQPILEKQQEIRRRLVKGETRASIYRSGFDRRVTRTLFYKSLRKIFGNGNISKSMKRWHRERKHGNKQSLLLKLETENIYLRQELAKAKIKIDKLMPSYRWCQEYKRKKLQNSKPKNINRSMS